MEEKELEIIKKTTEELLENMTIKAFTVVVALLLPKKEESGEALGAKDSIIINIAMEDPQMLIGQNGQTLFELSRLLRIILQKKLKNDFYVELDINDYKKNKVEYLKNMAKDAANEVSLTKEKKVLPFMPSYERRVIHMELAQRKDVIGQSQGEGFERCIIVSPVV